MSGMWCEARCQGLCDEGQSGCYETAPGAFGVPAAAETARREGWKIVRGEWLCPVCRRRRAALEQEDATR